MSLEQKDIEVFEKLIYKNSDDVAVSIARSFERLEDRIDAAESRIYSRLSDIEDKTDDKGVAKPEVVLDIQPLPKKEGRAHKSEPAEPEEATAG